MTTKEIEDIKEYANMLNDEVFKGVIEMLLNWMEEKGSRLPSNKQEIIDDSTKGFKLMRNELEEAVFSEFKALENIV